MIKRLILTALVAIISIGGTALAQRKQLVLHLMCNAQSHDGGRWARVEGTYYKIADCDAAAKAHRENHGIGSKARTQCSIQ